MGSGHDAPWLWLLPLVPLTGFVLNATLGQRLRRSGGEALPAALGIGAVAVSLAGALLALWQLLQLPVDERVLVAPGWTLVEFGTFQLRFGLRLDALSGVPGLIIPGVGLLIHVYSVGYMAGDAGFVRFFAFLNLFVGAMLLLVLADGFGLLFLGWEGVGLASYLLIGFWHREPANAAAGLKAFVTNRVGDVGLVLGICVLLGATGTLELQGSAAQAASLDPDTVTLACLLLFAGAAAKSAQFPLHVWLPDAMAGPTPVSALIHAATMVTAGVYLFARLHFLLVHSPVAMAVLAGVGAFTALGAALAALVQTDLKRILAYSTISQLGFMFLGLGTGGFSAAVFHLLTHACFKACLFLGAGAVIHACHTQDVRRMGGLGQLMPATARTYAYGCVALSGLPLASGFFSKDELLWSALGAGASLPWPWLGPLLAAVGLLAALCTAVYAWRSHRLVFAGDYRGTGQPHEAPRSMTGVLSALALLTGATALLGLWPPLGHALHVEWLQTPPLARWLGPVFAHAQAAEWAAGPRADLGLGVEWALVLASAGVALGGYLLAARRFGSAAAARAAVMAGAPDASATGLGAVLLAGFRLDALYARAFVRPTLVLGRLLDAFDRHVLDGLLRLLAAAARGLGRAHAWFDANGVDGAVTAFTRVLWQGGRAVTRLQTGRIGHYLLVAAGGVLLLYGVAFLLR